MENALTNFRQKDCEHCGTSFTWQRRTARFCSTRCRVAFNQKKEMEQVSCLHCQTPFMRLRSDNVYCSDACRIAAHRKRMIEATKRAAQRRG